MKTCQRNYSSHFNNQAKNNLIFYVLSFFLSYFLNIDGLRFLFAICFFIGFFPCLPKFFYDSLHQSLYFQSFILKRPFTKRCAYFFSPVMLCFSSSSYESASILFFSIFSFIVFIKGELSLNSFAPRRKHFL